MTRVVTIDDSDTLDSTLVFAITDSVVTRSCVTDVRSIVGCSRASDVLNSVFGSMVAEAGMSVFIIAGDPSVELNTAALGAELDSPPCGTDVD
jgi:hypothetical protein